MSHEPIEGFPCRLSQRRERAAKQGLLCKDDARGARAERKRGWRRIVANDPELRTEEALRASVLLEWYEFNDELGWWNERPNTPAESAFWRMVQAPE